VAGDLAAVGADFRRDGACVVRGLLDDVQVARLSEGVEDNLAAPSERAIEGGAESGSGRFFEDFRNWDRVREYEEVIRDARIGGVATRRSWRNALAQATVGMAGRTAGGSGVAESSGRRIGSRRPALTKASSRWPSVSTSVPNPSRSTSTTRH
jgi:hypothetical protein